MTQKRKALFLPFNLAIASAASAVHAVGIDRRDVPGRPSRGSAL